jgi:hypothetical protein
VTHPAGTLDPVRCIGDDAGRVRHRLNRGGNRYLNAILHRVAIARARKRFILP